MKNTQNTANYLQKSSKIDIIICQNRKLILFRDDLNAKLIISSSILVIQLNYR